jgi:hypothetical protein
MELHAISELTPLRESVVAGVSPAFSHLQPARLPLQRERPPENVDLGSGESCVYVREQEKILIQAGTFQD